MPHPDIESPKRQFVTAAKEITILFNHHDFGYRAST